MVVYDREPCAANAAATTGTSATWPRFYPSHSSATWRRSCPLTDGGDWIRVESHCQMNLHRIQAGFASRAGSLDDVAEA